MHEANEVSKVHSQSAGYSPGSGAARAGPDLWPQETRGPISRLHGRQRPIALVAEDEADMRELICLVLYNAGWAVEGFSDGDSLWAALAQRFDCIGGPPDLIVTDVRMPGHSGIEVLNHLRFYDRVTPVIIVTAFGDPGLASTAHQLGAKVIEKPFDLDELRHVAATYAGLVRR